MTQTNDSHGTVRSWVLSYTDSLYSWACTKVGDKAAAEDLVQETFLSAFQSFDKFRADSSPKTWLFSILNNKIIDHFRLSLKTPIVSQDAEFFAVHFDGGEHWHRTECITDWQGADLNLLDNNDFQGILQKCMKKLPGNWNAALQSKYLEEKDGKEICQDLQISPSNFWQLMHRAKLQLRKCLELNWFKK